MKKKDYFRSETDTVFIETERLLDTTYSGQGGIMGNADGTNDPLSLNHQDVKRYIS